MDGYCEWYDEWLVDVSEIEYEECIGTGIMCWNCSFMRFKEHESDTDDTSGWNLP